MKNAFWTIVLLNCLIILEVNGVEWFEGSPERFLPIEQQDLFFYESGALELEDHSIALDNEPRIAVHQPTNPKPIPSPSATRIFPPGVDPLFVIWVPPLTNDSLEHHWTDELVLAKVQRPIVKVYPEQCHLDYSWNGKRPKNVLYVVGATRAPEWLASCLERERLIREALEASAKKTGVATERGVRIGLNHMSDEYIGWNVMCAADDYIEQPQGFIRCESRMILYYDLFDYVLRNHWHEKLERYGEKLLWLPLGTTHGFGTPTLNSIIPASMRKFRCSFRGCKWEARRSFFDALAKLESANDLYCELNWSMKFRDGIDIRGFRQELLQTRFALCPIGNYNPDCFRIYEALTAGAIPIIPKHPEFDPLGDHPIPMIESWDDLYTLIEKLEQEGVDVVQQRIFTWWHDYLNKMQDKVAALIR